MRIQYRTSTLDDILPTLARVRIYSTVDARNGFWHLELDEESSKLTTFAIPFGPYRWLRLTQGISVSPELFQLRMHQALEGLQFMFCIDDDILITGSDESLAEAQMDHDGNIRAVFERCSEKGIKLNKAELQLIRTSVTFMGHELTIEGLRTDGRKVQTIQDLKEHSDKPAFMCLIGMITFFGKVLPQFRSDDCSIASACSQ